MDYFVCKFNQNLSRKNQITYDSVICVIKIIFFRASCSLVLKPMHLFKYDLQGVYSISCAENIGPFFHSMNTGLSSNICATQKVNTFSVTGFYQLKELTI